MAGAFLAPSYTVDRRSGHGSPSGAAGEGVGTATGGLSTLRAMGDALAEAWSNLHEVTPPRWYVGRPSYHEARRQWMLYAFDPTEKAIVGVRQREWEAVGDTELSVVQEMVRCLREISAGRVPRLLARADASRRQTKSDTECRALSGGGPQRAVRPPDQVSR